MLIVVLLSAHYLKSEKVCGNPWFALSSHAFHTEAVNGQDGYTILRAPARETSENSLNTSGETQQDLVEIRKQEYMQWEFSQASDGRF